MTHRVARSIDRAIDKRGDPPMMRNANTLASSFRARALAPTIDLPMTMASADDPMTTAIAGAFRPLRCVTDQLCSLVVDVGPVVSLGDGPYGERRYVDIIGGRVDGDGLQGVVVSGGTDWQIARADGVVDIEAHYSLLLDDGARVEILGKGMRHGPPDVLRRLARGDDVDPSEYFFRTFVRFQTGATRLAELNRTMAIAIGARRATTVELTVYRLR